MMMQILFRRTPCCVSTVLRIFFLLLFTNPIFAQQNITLDDTNPYIMYAPATSWHASSVACATCLTPPSPSARDGTWHDGTHIIPTIDEDDEGTVGDLDGDNTTSTSNVHPAETSAVTNVAGNDNDGNDDDDGVDNDSHGQKSGKGKDESHSRRTNRSVKWRHLGESRSSMRRDDENPFEVQNIDADDPGFQDLPVTATLNFTGQAVYVFSIIPLFPAPPNTTPTFTNLSFTLDGAPRGSFTYRPDPTVPGTPTVNNSDTEKFQPNVNVFSASSLKDTNHSLVVNVGVDSVFLLDYIVYTPGASDPTIPGSITTAAPDSQRTVGSVSNSGVATNKHNVATFAGAVGGSFGLLSVFALSLCISIRFRRRRARLRENARRAPFAQTFTARDHGEYGPEDEERSNEPVMTQATPAPFVPRYFPNSLPASPPPYAADGDRVVATSISRAGLPITEPATLPPTITLPTAILDLQRTMSNNSSNSYADRPPPTPPDEDMHISLFGPVGVREDRNSNGGVIGPLPIDTPLNEESDPMLTLEMGDENGAENMPANRRSLESISSRTFGSIRSSRGSTSSALSGTNPSTMPTRTSILSSMSARADLQPKEEVALKSDTPPALSTSSSLSSFSAPSSSRLLSSPSYPDLAQKPASPDGLTSITYPLLQPSRVPLPPSIYGSNIGSRETLERHESRT